MRTCVKREIRVTTTCIHLGKLLLLAWRNAQCHFSFNQSTKCTLSASSSVAIRIMQGYCMYCFAVYFVLHPLYLLLSDLDNLTSSKTLISPVPHPDLRTNKLHRPLIIVFLYLSLTTCNYLLSNVVCPKSQLVSSLSQLV